MPAAHESETGAVKEYDWVRVTKSKHLYIDNTIHVFAQDAESFGWVWQESQALHEDAGEDSEWSESEDMGSGFLCDKGLVDAR